MIHHVLMKQKDLASIDVDKYKDSSCRNSFFSLDAYSTFMRKNTQERFRLFILSLDIETGCMFILYTIIR